MMSKLLDVKEILRDLEMECLNIQNQVDLTNLIYSTKENFYDKLSSWFLEEEEEEEIENTFLTELNDIVFKKTEEIKKENYLSKSKNKDTLTNLNPSLEQLEKMDITELTLEIEINPISIVNEELVEIEGVLEPVKLSKEMIPKHTELLVKTDNLCKSISLELPKVYNLDKNKNLVIINPKEIKILKSETSAHLSIDGKILKQPIDVEEVEKQLEIGETLRLKGYGFIIETKNKTPKTTDIIILL